MWFKAYFIFSYALLVSSALIHSQMVLCVCFETHVLVGFNTRVLREETLLYIYDWNDKIKRCDKGVISHTHTHTHKQYPHMNMHHLAGFIQSTSQTGAPSYYLCTSGMFEVVCVDSQTSSLWSSQSWCQGAVQCCFTSQHPDERWNVFKNLKQV